MVPGVFEIDFEGVIVGWSPAAARFVGLAAEQALGRTVASLCDPSEAELLAAACRGGERSLTVSVRRSDGSRSYVQLSLTRAREDRLMVVLVDRTVEETRDRERDRFLAMMAHDLRQPLTVIDAATQIFTRRDRANDPLLGRMRAAVTRLTEIASELLDTGSAQLGEMILKRESVDLAELTHELADSLKLTHPDHALTVESEGEVRGSWDPRRLRRVVGNLLENALSHSDPGSPVAVRCLRAAPHQVLLTVENLCAEEPDELERLFEPFVKKSEHGTAGLGLYIARQLARAHGGAVTAHFERGVVRFALSLPLYTAQRRHPRSPLEAELEIGAGDRVFWVKGRDISRRGLAFEGELDLSPDDQVRVGVYSEGAVLSLLGTVRHVSRSDQRSVVGVEFPVELSPAEVALILRPGARSPFSS